MFKKLTKEIKSEKLIIVKVGVASEDHCMRKTL